MDSKLIEYFENRTNKSRLFVERFTGGIEFERKRVLDIGCGLGALSCVAATAGALQVVGIDPNPRRINVARKILTTLSPEVQDRVQFREGPIEDHKPGQFDIIVSQAVLEHVSDPTTFLSTAAKNLVAGGRFYLGFGPLYRAPYGDHRYLKIPAQKLFPWAHAIGSQRSRVAAFNRRNPERQVENLQELGLNGLHYRDFHDIIHSCELRVVSYEVNVSQHHLKYALNLLRKLPFLSEYLAFNIYTILER